MNIQLPAKAFQSEQEQRAHAAAVRKRLLGQTIHPHRIEQAKSRISELEEDLTRQEEENGRLVAKISGLELDLADLRASFMSQARYLADVEDKLAGGEGGVIFTEKKPVTRIVMEVLKDFPGITWEDILSPRRSRGLINPRHACIKAVCAQRPDLSFPAVGRIFHRDHTTILNALHSKKKQSTTAKPSKET